MSIGSSRFRALDYFKITILGFALGAVANGMHAIILPLRVQDFAGSGQKSTLLGLITFTGLVIAIIMQPVAGAISDRSGWKWGKRRPFILTGILLAIGIIFGVGLAGDYVTLFILWGMMQASLNFAQGPYQGFIPDLVPLGKRGLASGIKSFLEILGGVALLRVVGNLMGNYHSAEDSRWLFISLGILGAVLAVTLLITIITVKEKPAGGGLNLSWRSILYETFRINVKTNSGFILFLISRLLFLMSLTTLQTFALYYFQDVVKVSNPAKITADLVTAVGIAMLIVVYPAGRFSDRIGRKSILVACGGLGALGIALIFFFHQYQMIIFAGGLIGIAAGAFLSTNWAMATDLLPRGEAARYLGLTNLASAGGAALARLIGPLIDFFNGYGEGLGYSIMLAMCFIYFIVGAILILRIKIVKTPEASSPEG